MSSVIDVLLLAEPIGDVTHRFPVLERERRRRVADAVKLDTSDVGRLNQLRELAFAEQQREPRIGRLLTLARQDSIHGCRPSTVTNANVTLLVSGAVALGMHDFSSVLRQCHPVVPMLLRDQREDLFEFGQGRFAGVHECVAASKSRDLGHPGPVVLPVQEVAVVWVTANDKR